MSVKLKHEDIVSVFGFEGDVIVVEDDKVLIHFGGESLHTCQDWYNLDDVKLVIKEISL